MLLITEGAETLFLTQIINCLATAQTNAKCLSDVIMHFLLFADNIKNLAFVKPNILKTTEKEEWNLQIMG